jgi:hypothetical protein
LGEKREENGVGWNLILYHLPLPYHPSIYSPYYPLIYPTFLPYHLDPYILLTQKPVR